MFRRFIGIFFVLCTLALVTLSAIPVAAQTAKAEKPPLYTYVSEWVIPRAMWADYAKLATSYDEMMAKAVADGTIVAFGSYEVLNHQEGQATHGSWFSASSMANLIKELEVRRATARATDAILAASKHWDLVLVSRDYNDHSGTFKNAYLRVGNWGYKAGASDPDGKIMKATIVAMLEKLLADGALHGYQIAEEAVHSADPDRFHVAITTNGAEGIDKFYAALEAAEKANPAAWAGYDSLLESKGHRDFLAHVTTMTHK